MRVCSPRARVRHPGGAHARQLPVDGQHRAPAGPHRPGAPARPDADRPAGGRYGGARARPRDAHRRRRTRCRRTSARWRPNWRRGRPAPSSRPRPCWRGCASSARRPREPPTTSSPRVTAATTSARAWPRSTRAARQSGGKADSVGSRESGVGEPQASTSASRLEQHPADQRPDHRHRQAPRQQLIEQLARVGAGGSAAMHSAPIVESGERSTRWPPTIIADAMRERIAAAEPLHQAGDRRQERRQHHPRRAAVDRHDCRSPVRRRR